jgi:hypothetical protein
MVMLAFGGIGTLFGPIIGALTFTVVDELLIDVGQLRQVAYGMLIIVLFLWMPRGVIPSLTALFRRDRGLKNAIDTGSTESAAGNLQAVSGESQSTE